MKDAAGMTEPKQFMDEMKATDGRIEELRGYRRQMLGQIDDSQGFRRLLHNLNFLLSEKQIARHLRILKIHRDRVGQHYKLAVGEEPPTPAWELERDKPGVENSKGSK